MNRKYTILAAIGAVILAADIATKQWALRALPRGRSVLLFEEWLGDGLPLTLAFNKGAAFSLSVGSASRWFFIAVSFLALGVLFWIYREARRDDTLRLVSASLVAAGAVGNLIDRLRWDQGVVDFLGPVNLGFMRWPIFNVADSAITVGSILLVISLYKEERELRRAEGSAEARASEGGA